MLLLTNTCFRIKHPDEFIQNEPAYVVKDTYILLDLHISARFNFMLKVFAIIFIFVHSSDLPTSLTYLPDRPGGSSGPGHCAGQLDS